MFSGTPGTDKYRYHIVKNMHTTRVDRMEWAEEFMPNISRLFGEPCYAKVCHLPPISKTLLLQLKILEHQAATQL